MSLWDAPIWQDPGTWIVLGVSLLFIVVGGVMHHIIMKIVRSPAPEMPPKPSAAEPAPNKPTPEPDTPSSAPSPHSTQAKEPHAH